MKTKEQKLEAGAKKFQKTHVETAKAIFPDLLQFLVELGNEGERSAVVLGAERVNVALEELLKAFLRPGSTKDDEHLFKSDGGALATFARKTEVAYRLGLVDSQFKQALTFVRKLRNDFAHATRVESLEAEIWIMDNGSSHRGQHCVERLQSRYANLQVVHGPIHASWLNQIEIYFSIIQRKVLTPNDFASLAGRGFLR